ncbi:MAG: hypothetical protein BZ138_07820, partial [Methanosphaera sp. rholeuAM270]
VFERGFEIVEGDICRTFESENYSSNRVFFENGVIDGGYSKIKFDFSECEFNNNVIIKESEPEEILVEEEPWTLTEDEFEEELIELE